MSLAKRPPESMLRLQDRAGKYIKVKEIMNKMTVNNEPTRNKNRKTDQYDAKEKYPRIGKSSDPLFKEESATKAHKIEVITDQPLRNILHSPNACGRLIKWEIELGEFDIKYNPRTAIKAQALADFVVECTINDQEVGGQEIVIPEEGEKEKDKGTTLKEYWILHFDGASKTKSSGAGLVLQSPDGFMIGAVRAKNLKVCGDSRLVTAQVNGEFEPKDDTMAMYLRVVKGILTQFDEWYAKHVPIEENTTADALSQFASTEIENYPRSIYFQVLKTPTIHVKNMIAPVGVTSCWIDPIKTHLETGWLTDDAQKERKLSIRALRYSLIEGFLYKRSFVIPYLKYLRPLEAEEALKEAHEGIYGQHLGGRALAHKITRLGFY
ncbi:uncharacterized protein LOC141699884 [Apium graveolens]|uniref:uncharacterized protein LOC141699884 n=1 Tax=Apium graveolens TaxID=4045 RepID=UPI003D791E41